MKESFEHFLKKINKNGTNAKTVLLALGLILGASNFSYSQNIGGGNINRTGQVNGQGGRNIETYRMRVKDREAGIMKTNETINEFVKRLGNQFNLEVNKGNNNTSLKINQIKNILNIKSNNNIFIIQTALKTLAKTDKYKGLSEYTNKFSGEFDLNFINAIGYIQFMNGLYDNGSLLGKNGESTLNSIIRDLDNKGNYDAMIEKRYNDIRETNETLDGFVKRMNMQFKFEADNTSSLISKKVSNIQRLLNNKYNLKTNDDKILIIQSALIELSKTEKYRGLQKYVENFSGKFDLNFIDAYGLVQYVNKLDCNWALHGNEGTLILQSMYDDLETNLNNDNNLNKNKEDNDGVQNIEQTQKELEGIALLSNNLSLNNLNGITYENVWNTVNGFRHEGLRNAVMDRLLHNDIIGAQKLLGMDLNCDSRLYPDYVAGRKLGKRELKLMEKHSEFRRYMDSQEFLNVMEKVERAYEIENYEVKTAYLKFLSGEFDNKGLPYCIISKYDYKIYLFSADHKFLASYPVVVGAHVGNHPNDVGEHLKDPENAHHTTPGGMYRFGGFFERSLTGKDLTIGFGTHFGTFEPLEGQYNFSSECALGIHGFVMGREPFFYSQEMKNRTKSNGCINFLRKLFGDIFNHLKNGSMIYICKDDEISNDGGIGYIDNENRIEMIEHFGYNPQKTIHLNDAENYGYCEGNSGDTRILGRRILSQDSIVGSELLYRYNLNFVTSSKNTDIFNIFKQHEKTPYNKMHKKKYIS